MLGEDDVSAILERAKEQSFGCHLPGNFTADAVNTTPAASKRCHRRADSEGSSDSESDSDSASDGDVSSQVLTIVTHHSPQISAGCQTF